jgi:hypothetical protein
MGELAIRQPLAGLRRNQRSGISLTLNVRLRVRALAKESGVSSAFTGMSALQSPSGELGPPRVFHPAVGGGAGTRPNCSSIESRSNIKLNETCLPSRNRSTWM